MPEYTLRIRRYDPQSGEAAYWDEHTVELAPKQSVLDAILKVRDEHDGSIGIRCSCQQAICGSCGVRINGKPGLACNTHLDEAASAARTGWNTRDERARRTVIAVEPMGNMPVIRDLIVDMDAVHWKKIRRVTPWLINKEPVPEREYIVPHENMVDVTQTMACIQCGACVSDCLVDGGRPGLHRPRRARQGLPVRRRPARRRAPRAAQGPGRGRARDLRLHPLLQLHRRLPQGRRADEPDHAPAPRSPGATTRSRTATTATATSTRSSRTSAKNGLLHEADLLPDSYGGKFHPAGGARADRLAADGRRRRSRAGKMTPASRAARHPSTRRRKEVKKIFDEIDGREQRVELNLYVTGYEDEDQVDATRRMTTSRRPPPPPAEERRDTSERGSMKVAYWPGCVSRGFTPELHGSMAKVAPLLDIELIELDRAACCGAGVIAEHNQELADTLNARTFALAQQTDGELMMNICSTCQGAQSECQERLDANTEYREHVNANLADEGLTLREGPDQQELPLAAGRGDRPRRARRARSSGR